MTKRFRYGRAAIALVSLCAPAALLLAQKPIASQIARHDLSKYQYSKSVHNGPPGGYGRMTLFTQGDLETNLLFFRRGVLPPNGGIGHHFHHQIEEMFIILDGEAQFTIDGRTSILKGPAAAPCKMGHSHAIWNHTDKTVQWMNISIASVRGRYDTEDLNDDRMGVPLDPKPVFTHMRLDQALLASIPKYRGGQGTARYRRALRPEMFQTNWAYVDHMLLPRDASEGLHRHDFVEEIYYVVNGRGKVTLNGQSAEIAAGDAVKIHPRDAHAFFAAADSDIEFMIFGIALEQDKLDTTEMSEGAPQGRGRGSR